MIRIGENIRLARNKKGYSQEYMAEKLSVSAQAYDELESKNQNSLTWGQIFEIATLLDTDVESLVISHSDLNNSNQPEKKPGEEQEVDQLRELVRMQKELLTALKKNVEVKILT
ncbi:helix-turn-helix domain-containing protein [Dyadobacter psychrotolerans]|uniref:XRE family transcriptional regulator n=1 Tax=Dyadobacter psychrotolerans TaxID=2541721 RepID=A0A4R5E2M2_9BACT|nr:helix-turn-helix domain-containing protein [Dyadobacter psychrotolerans]TDE18665.1 XRE family transcriptional regulator [Dyadobacter psychrotolerans]